MSGDLDELRTVLRARAALAPPTDGMLAATHRLVHLRQVRRRVSLLAGVAVVTALALIGVGLFGATLPHDRSASRPAGPLAIPVLPFTVGTVPTGYRMVNWFLDAAEPHEPHPTGPLSAVQYQGASRFDLLSVTLEPVDPSIGMIDVVHTLVDGRPATFGDLPDVNAGTPLTTEHLTWQVGSDRWFDIAVAMSAVHEQRMLATAASVTLTPSTVPDPLRIPNLPAGLSASEWYGLLGPDTGTEDVDVTLCPPNVYPADADADECVDVHMGTGVVQQVSGTRPIPASHDDRPVPRTFRNITPLITDGGHVVTRQVSPAHWIAAVSDGTSPLLVLRLVMTASDAR